MNKNKLFKMNEIFTIHKGKRLTKYDMAEGNLNYIGAISNNNGVRQRIDAESMFDGNCITVNYNGSVGEAFYQYKPFWASDDVNVLKLKDKTVKFDEELAFYLITLIKANKYRFSYGRKWTLEKMEETEILLPTDANERVDWIYMKNYISSLKKKHITSKNTNVNKIVNVHNWREFQVGDFFKIERGKRIVRNVDYFSVKNEEYCYNVITSTTQNNGVDGYYFDKNCSGNSLVCGGEASGMFTTYQKDECWVMDRARIFKAKPSVVENLNKYSYLFLATILNKNQYKYSYGRTANPSEIEKLVVKLPVDEKGIADWSYMECFMKSLPYGDRI